jgi:hypothetical protein
MRDTCSAYVILLDLIILITCIFGEKYTLWSSLLCIFLWHIISSVLCPRKYETKLNCWSVLSVSEFYVNEIDGASAPNQRAMNMLLY